MADGRPRIQHQIPRTTELRLDQLREQGVLTEVTIALLANNAEVADKDKYLKLLYSLVFQDLVRSYLWAMQQENQEVAELCLQWLSKFGVQANDIEELGYDGVVLLQLQYLSKRSSLEPVDVWEGVLSHLENLDTSAWDVSLLEFSEPLSDAAGRTIATILVRQRISTPRALYLATISGIRGIADERQAIISNFLNEMKQRFGEPPASELES